MEKEKNCSNCKHTTDANKTYKLTEVQKEIILEFAKNNMNLSKTARVMHYHRSNVVYHFAKIYENLRLNPYCFYDLVELVKMSKQERRNSK